MRELFAQLQEWKEGQGTGTMHWMAAVPALPSAPADESRVHIIDQQTNFLFGKFLIINGKKLIHVFNVLFGLRVNAIPNKTFIWDSHQPIICNSQRWASTLANRLNA
jgi:hypothetical protein